MATSVFGPPSPLRFSQGAISPKIWVEIGGDKAGSRDDITRFQLVGDVRTLYDPFSFDIPNDRGQNTYLLGMRFHPIRIWHSDPAVANGLERPWFYGVIVTVSQRSSQTGGSVITIAGFDKGWWLTSNAPYWTNLRFETDEVTAVTYESLLRKIIDVDWEFDAVLDRHIGSFLKLGQNELEVQQALRFIDAKRALINQQTNRQEITLATTGFKQLLPQIQIEIGTTCGDLLMRYAVLEHNFVGVSPLGQLQIWSPDYKAKTQYSFHWHSPHSGRSSSNDIEEATYELSAETVYNVMTCCWTRIVGVDIVTTAPNRQDKNEGKGEAHLPSSYLRQAPTYVNAAGRPVKRQLSFMDDNQFDQDKADRRVVWRYQQGIYEGDTLIYDTFGHSKGGVPYVENTMVEVDDSWNEVSGLRYLSRVELSQDIRGTRARLHLKLPDLLAA